MTPQFAYFPVSHFSLGGFFQINNYDHEIDAKYILSIRGLSLGASARYYFQIEKATPFLELSGIINSSQYGIGYKVGIDYFLSNNVSFEPSIAFINMQAAEMYENREKINTKVLIIGIGVNCFIF
jgi:hypothetical protein